MRKVTLKQLECVEQNEGNDTALLQVIADGTPSVMTYKNINGGDVLSLNNLTYSFQNDFTVRLDEDDWFGDDFIGEVNFRNLPDAKDKVLSFTGNGEGNYEITCDIETIAIRRVEIATLFLESNFLGKRRATVIDNASSGTGEFPMVIGSIKAFDLVPNKQTKLFSRVFYNSL